jgi:hypothetical protein
MVNPPKC